MTKISNIESALEDLYNNCFGLGSFTLTLQFEADTNEEELWIDATITPTGDPQNDLAAFCGEANSFQEAIIKMVEEMRDPLLSDEKTG